MPSYSEIYIFKNSNLTCDQKREVLSLINSLADNKMILPEGRIIEGTRTRLLNLLPSLIELGNNNPVALWVRYFWETEILKILNNEFYYPSIIGIDLTTYCNNSCFFCKEGLEKERHEYPFSKLKKDLKEFSQIPNIKFIIYSGGGEPTCYSHFAEALYLTHQYGFGIYVSTNGGLIGTPSLPLEAFVDNITILKFSIGAPTHKTYNIIHHSTESKLIKKGSLQSVDYVFQQIKALVRLRNKKGRISEENGFRVKLPLIIIGMVVSPINQKEVLLMTKRAVEVGADMLWLRPVLTTDKNLLKIKEGIRQMQKAKKIYGKKIEIITFLHRLKFNTLKEDYFGRCVCHPVISPWGEKGAKGSIIPCVFRRGNRPQNFWLATSGPCEKSILEIIKSKKYQKKINDQDKFLNSNDSKRCPRCRKTLNNIFLDILFRATHSEREKIRQIILTLFPPTPLSQALKYLY